MAWSFRNIGFMSFGNRHHFRIGFELFSFILALKLGQTRLKSLQGIFRPEKVILFQEDSTDKFLMKTLQV